MRIYTLEYLDQALVQRQNMAVCKYKSVKITKIQDLQSFTPRKLKSIQYFSSIAAVVIMY